MGTKNKEIANTKRRQKAAMKAKERKSKRYTPPPVPKTSLASLLKGVEVPQSLFSDEAMKFWLCHGINCIVSDYDKGIWTPLFEDIYTGGETPDAESIAQTIMDKYNQGNKEWPPEAKAALAWTVQEQAIVYMYYKEAQRRLTAAFGGDADIEGKCREPHNPIVWALFAYLKEKILKTKAQ